METNAHSTYSPTSGQPHAGPAPHCRQVDALNMGRLDPKRMQDLGLLGSFQRFEATGHVAYSFLFLLGNSVHARRTTLVDGVGWNQGPQRPREHKTRCIPHTVVSSILKYDIPHNNIPYTHYIRYVLYILDTYVSYVYEYIYYICILYTLHILKTVHHILLLCSMEPLGRSPASASTKV